MTDIQELSKKLRERAESLGDLPNSPKYMMMTADETLDLIDELDRLIEVEKVLRLGLEKLQAGYSGMFGHETVSSEKEAWEKAPEIVEDTLKRADEIGKGQDEKA